MDNEKQNTDTQPSDPLTNTETAFNEDIDNSVQLNEINREPIATAPQSTLVMGQSVAGGRIVQGKSYKTLIISIVVFLFVVLAGCSGFAYWYFGIRTADVEYDKASAIVDSLISDAKSLQTSRSTLEQGTTTKSTLTSIQLTSIKLADAQSESTAILNKLSDAQDKVSEYLNNQKLLVGSKVISSDGSVSAVYAANKKVIDDYGTSSDTMYKTGYIFYTLIDKCLVDMKFTPTATQTVDEYDVQAKPCKDYLTQTSTVPSKNFNDTIYVPYRKLMLDYIVNIDSLYNEKQGSIIWNQAYANILKIGQDVKKIDSSKADTIKNSQNPTNQLGKLKAKIEDRKKVFFR